MMSLSRTHCSCTWQQSLCDVHQVIVVSVGHVELADGELWVVGHVYPFIAKHSPNLQQEQRAKVTCGARTVACNQGMPSVGAMDAIPAKDLLTLTISWYKYNSLNAEKNLILATMMVYNVTVTISDKKNGRAVRVSVTEGVEVTTFKKLHTCLPHTLGLDLQRQAS